MNETDRKASRAQACPICGRPTDRVLRPFCSKRCSDIDLNRWLSGVYALPTKNNEDEDVERPPEREADEE